MSSNVLYFSNQQSKNPQKYSIYDDIKRKKEKKNDKFSSGEDGTGKYD